MYNSNDLKLCKRSVELNCSIFGAPNENCFWIAGTDLNLIEAVVIFSQLIETSIICFS